MLAYVHKYLCYSAEQSLKRNEVSAAVTGTTRVLSLIQYFVLLLIINPFNDIIPSVRIVFLRFCAIAIRKRPESPRINFRFRFEIFDF